MKAHPERKRARANEPVVTTPVGAPPNGMPATACAIWNELAHHGFWLTAADRLMLEIACRLFADFRSGALDGGGISKLITALSKLGFTPTDRSKVGAPGAKEEEADEFADFRV
ncbi:hypothetical protein VSX64_13260 [Aurantimonas sp. C2-6-R+9]|uniref:hypothetical protein n=1 Tax=unclassified Aurantimonas TaxID=2638230 RepID=UPI002E17C6F5|nr:MULTISPECIES: hypothetical protein [unclassified Aurantimonas]MEC5291656.1 hypothetical protein [Aurantimonas sp. C2-3-R2]MEC5381838.1 hypothetical protein [Aurantimonas sp. C2-6-R+9]MEC5412740.1 hypothetical protein [Aurantimonas sp. C2-4-R8]